MSATRSRSISAQQAQIIDEYGSAPRPDEPAMPGMATRREVARLAAASGIEVDRQFCQLMLRHHLGGLHMIDEVLQRSRRPEVTALARAMRADQQREIEALQRLLARLSAGGRPA